MKYNSTSEENVLSDNEWNRLGWILIGLLILTAFAGIILGWVLREFF